MSAICNRTVVPSVGFGPGRVSGAKGAREVGNG
jgi:hypothetical protein